MSAISATVPSRCSTCQPFPGSIGLWEAATGTLFSGDAVYDGPLLDELDGSDVEDYVATMQRLRARCPSPSSSGHEPSFGRQRLIEICDVYPLASTPDAVAYRRYRP